MVLVVIFEPIGIIMNYNREHSKPTKFSAEKVTGSQPYMAPERVLHHPYDEKVDMFSVGVIFYILLAKCHPYEHLLKGTVKDYIEKVVLSIMILNRFTSWMKCWSNLILS